MIYHLEIDEIGAVRSRYCSSSKHYVLRDSQHLEGLRYAEHLCEKVNFGLFPKDLQLLEVVENEATRSVASVPAVYQFLSVEQKSKVIFVPRSYF